MYCTKPTSLHAWNARGLWENDDFRPISCSIWETVGTFSEAICFRDGLDCAQWCIYDTLWCIFDISWFYVCVWAMSTWYIANNYVLDWCVHCPCTTILPCQYNMGCQNLRSTIAVRYLLTTPSISIHSSYDPVICSGFTDDDLTTQVVDPVSLEYQSGGIVHSALTAWRHPWSPFLQFNLSIKA